MTQIEHAGLTRIEGLLLVGGSSRHVGKTTLICDIIKNFSKSVPIIAIKIKTLHENDQRYHGKDMFPWIEDYKLFEEFDPGNNTDSSNMLRAGALRSFKLKVNALKLEEAFKSFLNLFNSRVLIICESNSIRKITIPDLYLFVQQKNNSIIKPNAIELEKYIDERVYCDDMQYNFDIKKLQISESCWLLNN